MKCPNDDSILNISERNGIEIDYCPTCRGVWLDRGELDKLIDRSQASGDSYSPAPQQSRYEAPRSEYQSNSHQHQKKHKKESFLGDLFDF
jgi:Zn-finger nucleic acid-binding protein